MTGISHFSHTLSAQMMIACKNHLQLGFQTRLLQYICTRYPTHYSTAAQAWTLIYQVFPEFADKSKQSKKRIRDKVQSDVSTKKKMKTSKDQGKVVIDPTANNEPLGLSEQECKRFRDWLKYFPDDTNIKRYFQHFISLMYDMLCFYGQNDKCRKSTHFYDHAVAERLSAQTCGNGFSIVRTASASHNSKTKKKQSCISFSRQWGEL